MVVNEDGLRESYKLVLESAPTAPVSIKILPRDGKGIRTRQQSLPSTTPIGPSPRKFLSTAGLRKKINQENQQRMSLTAARSHDPLYSECASIASLLPHKRAPDLDVTPAPELRSIVTPVRIRCTFDFRSSMLRSFRTVWKVRAHRLPLDLHLCNVC